MNRDNKSKADAAFESWPEWKKQFTVTKYSDGNGRSVQASPMKGDNLSHSASGKVSKPKV